jgi:ABC-2 type transport system permease protein
MTTSSIPSLAPLETSVLGGAPAARRNPLAVVLHQIRYDLRALVRNRQAQMFTLGMPVMFLVLFVAIFGNGTVPVGGHQIKGSTYYVANLTTFAIVDAAFMTLAISLVVVRESGILLRRRATPQPAWSIISARATTAVITAAASATLLLLIGRVAYGASVPLGALPALVLAVVAGCVVFVALGFAATTVIGSLQAAQPVAMALALPLFFISGVFVPWGIIPPWLHQVAAVFPVRHLSLAVLTPFTHGAAQSPWSWSDLLVVVGWGAGGLAVALRRFTWAPQDT